MVQTTTCSDCSREVSVSANRCPHCGSRYPHHSRTVTPWSIAVVVVVVIALFFWLA